MEITIRTIAPPFSCCCCCPFTSLFNVSVCFMKNIYAIFITSYEHKKHKKHYKHSA